MLSPVRMASAGLLVAAVALAACSVTEQATANRGDSPTATPAPGATTTLDPNALYADFAECEPLPEPIEFDPVPGLVGLDGVVVLGVSEVGPITSLEGLVDLTPVDVRDIFAERDDVELIHLEDEGYEAEILVDSGEYRTFVKASIRCRTGSIIAFIVAPDDEAESLPVPGQQGRQTG